MYKLDIDSLDTHGSRSLFSIDYYLWLLFMIILLPGDSLIFTNIYMSCVSIEFKLSSNPIASIVVLSFGLATYSLPCFEQWWNSINWYGPALDFFKI